MLTLGLSTIVLWVNYQRSSATALRVAERLLEQAAGRIVASTDQLIQPLFTLTSSAVLLPGIDAGVDSRGAHPLGAVLLGLLERNPQMTAAYVGNGRGDFYRVAALEWLRAGPRAHLKAPPEASFAVQVIATERGRRMEHWRFLDARQRELGRRNDPDETYDPRTRAWYRAALASPQTIVTDVYPFASAPSLGLTVARRVGDAKATVFAADLTLTSLSRSLAAVRASQLSGTHNAEIAVFNLDGGLLAHSDSAAYERLLDAADTPRVPGVSELGNVSASILASVRAGAPAQVRIATADGVEWLAHVARLGPVFGESTYLAVAVPVDDVLGPLARSARETLLISLAVVLAFLPVVYFAAGAISAPLRRVTGEIAGLQNFDVGATPPIRSTIGEIHDLAAALATAKFMLGAFAKYVPKNLVRQLVAGGAEPRLGGERRPLTVFFSDVRDFTTISEQVSPERLMEFTSEYLEGLVKIILEHRGTVDKFVGDQVMAYWNAPTPNPNHAADGCRALLACRDWSNAQNVRWAREGTPMLYTRFGLHLGDAIVGNVGSSDRMDYTVVGASINLGSRIEGLNKVYGTQVLITQPVVDAGGNAFVHRPVDRVLPKGAVHPLDVHELVGGAETEVALVERCDAWRAFYAVYLRRDWPAAASALASFRERHGSDALTALYEERLRRFQAEPPPADWDGVMRYTQK